MHTLQQSSNKWNRQRKGLDNQGRGNLEQIITCQEVGCKVVFIFGLLHQKQTIPNSFSTSPARPKRRSNSVLFDFAPTSYVHITFHSKVFLLLRGVHDLQFETVTSKTKVGFAEFTWAAEKVITSTGMRQMLRRKTRPAA